MTKEQKLEIARQAILSAIQKHQRILPKQIPNLTQFENSKPIQTIVRQSNSIY